MNKRKLFNTQTPPPGISHLYISSPADGHYANLVQVFNAFKVFKTIPHLLLLFAILLIAVAFFTTPAQASAEIAQNLQPVKTGVSGGFDTLQRIEGILDREEIPSLPPSINGIPSTKLRDYSRLETLLRSAHKKRGVLIGYFLLYRDINHKLRAASQYQGEIYADIEISKLFTQGFERASAEALLQTTPYKLPENEDEYARAAIKELITHNGVAEFENKLVETKAVRPDKAKFAYENARSKMDLDLATLGVEFVDEMEKLRKEFKHLYLVNVKAVVRVSTAKNAPDTKNFQEKQPLVITLVSDTEGITGELPVTWTMKGPDGNTKKGRALIKGNQKGEAALLCDSVVPPGAMSGVYEIRVSVSPESDDEIEFKNSFTVGSVPFTITSVFVLDESKQRQEAFLQEDTLLLAVQYKPIAEKPEKGSFTWSVVNSAGAKIPAMSFTKELKLRTNTKPVQTKYIKCIIPKDLPDGSYTFRVTITAGKYKETSEPLKFKVSGGNEPD